MDIQNTPSTSTPKKPADDMFDDFDFRPITTGLGFNSSNKAEEAIQQARIQVAERSTPARVIPKSEHPFTAHQKHLSNGAPASDYVQNDLALFYGNGRETIMAMPELKEEKRPVLADMSVRFIAFFIDVLLLTAMTWITFAMVGYLTEIDFGASLWEGHTDMMIVVGTLFCGYFTLYFTVLEKFQGGSIGKEVLGLKVITMDGYGPSLLRAAARTFVTLLGTLSLGFTSWVDLAGKLTGTRVVRA